MTSRPKRLLICRLSAIGDTILTMPLLCALRRLWPDAEITWVVEAPASPLLVGHECLDRLIVLRRRWLRDVGEVLQLRRQLRQIRPDIAFDPQSLTKSAVVAWLSGAPLRIGCAGRHGRELSPLLNNRRVCPQRTHLVDRTLELLRPFTDEQPAVEYRIPLDDQAVEFVERLIERAHLGCGFAVVNPGAAWPSKKWPVERYGKVARYLGEQYQLPTVVSWGGPAEQRQAEQVVAHSGGHAIAAPPTSLRQLAALLSRARLFIGSDTGPMHLAAAVGTPCISLHGPTRPQDSGPYGPGHIAVQRRYQQGTSRQRRRASNEAMCQITVEEVCRTVDRMMVGPSCADRAAA